MRLKAVEDAVRGKPANADTGEMAGKLAVEGAVPLQFNGYKIPLMRNLVKRAIAGTAQPPNGMSALSSGAWRRHAQLIQWATSPWGKSVPIHIAWGLIWVAVIAGLCFMIVHALYLIIVKPPKRFAERKAEVNAAAIPERVPRHSLAARLFHWIMAASMFTLLFTAFLPKVGVQFNWVVYHWIAGLVLTVSILFHIVHATFFLDFWSIWPDKTDVRDAMNRVRRFFGKTAPLPDKFAKYPLENKLYHGVILLAGLAVIVTGLFMMKRVQTGIFTRNPYLFSAT